MTLAEAVSFFYAKKSSKEMSKQEIMASLKSEYHFTPSEIKKIIIGISDRELYEIENKPSPLSLFLHSKAFSVLFFIFGIVVIITSILFLNTDNSFVRNQNMLTKTLPWVMIAGGLLMVIKHGKRLIGNS